MKITISKNYYNLGFWFTKMASLKFLGFTLCLFWFKINFILSKKI